MDNNDRSEKEMSKRVYISGKIGEEVISHSTYLKFAKAEELLKSGGWETFNPCDEKWQTHLKEFYPINVHPKDMSFYAYALLRDMMALATKDAICLLPDWKDSPGARTELAFAKATGKTIMELTECGELATWQTD